MNNSLNFGLMNKLIATSAAIFLTLGSMPSHASRLQELGGSTSESLDKVYIDLDSITQDGDFRVATFLTVYEKARENAKGLKLDRHSQKTAFDCQRKQFALVATVGFLEGKQVGTSPVNSDWKNTLHDVPSNAFSQRLFAAVCNTAQAGSPQPNAGNNTPQTPPTTTPPNALPNTASKPKSSSGTGIAINSDGYILTNNHVVNGCKKIMVQGANAQQGSAQLEVMDPKNDLALLKTSLNFTQTASFRSQAKPAKLGEAVGVVGFPLMGVLSTEPKATFGQINSVAGMQNDYTLLQISAPIQGGNSGGPVFDSTGSVLGVVVSQASMALAALTGNVPQNINFAIRGEIAQIFMAAHRIKFAVANQQKKLETDEIAEIGRQISTFILCIRE